MTKQEEIQEGLAVKLASFEGRKYWQMPDVDKEYWLTQSSASLQYLHSQGVVIKVDRQLPRLKSITSEATVEEKSAFLLGLKYAQEGIIEAGYVAVESLI